MNIVFTCIFLAYGLAFAWLGYRWFRLEYKEPLLIAVISTGFGCALVAAYLSYHRLW